MSHPFKTKTALSLFALTTLVACSERSERAEIRNPAYTDSTTTTSSSTTRDADNTGRNQRDRNSNSVTADSQMASTSNDVEITRKIRAAIVEDDSLSANAKNVKIITQAGLVNLRGPVANRAESQKVASIAQKFAGETRVRNELEVIRE